VRKRGSLKKNKFQRRNYLVLVAVFSIALVVLFSHSIFQNSQQITGLDVGATPDPPNLYQQLVDKAIEEQELYTKMTQNSAERQKILVQIIAQQQVAPKAEVVADTTATPATPATPPTPAFTPEGCTDSDGKDYFKKGTVEVAKAQEKVDDYCSPSQKFPQLLLERICLVLSDGTLSTSMEQIYCSGPCDKGACPVSTKTAKCTETDNGKDLFVKGSAKYDSDTTALTDSCAGPMVAEYFCEDAVLKKKNFLCDTGFTCSDGACVKK